MDSDEKTTTTTTTTTTPPNQPTPASLTPTTPTTTHTDDESSSLTTSTESELLGTWTLVTDKAKLKLAAEADDEKSPELSPELKQAIDKAAAGTRMEELTDSRDDLEDGDFEEEDTKDSKADTTLDDFSDGISIISESDSGGRLSPHPFMRGHLQDLGSFHLPSNEEPAPKLPIVIDDSEAAAELRQRRRKRSSSRSKDIPSDGKALQPQGQSTEVAEAPPPLLPTIVRRGLSGIFYVGVALALLSVYGKMSNPEWESPLSAAKQPMAELQQKVIDMELQNNLMRAEIDILSRQVNYLSNAKHQMPPPTPGQQPREDRPRGGKGGKQFKAWTGNGESLEPVDIEKGDLKRPYKCADGHIEIAGMCVENRPDSFANTVEEVMDTLQGNAVGEDQPAKRLRPDGRRPEPPVFDAPPPPPPPPQQQEHEESRQRFGEPKYQKDFKPHNSREQKQRPNSKERFGKENRYPKNGGSDDGGSSKEQFRKRFKGEEVRNASPESGERFPRESHEKRRGSGGDSKEWRKPPHPKSSGERQTRGSGEWHEKMMHQRENSRRQHEQKRNDKNWYIERGAGREHMRYS